MPDKDVVHGDIVAARAAQPRGMPGVQDFALRQPHKALPGFRHAVAVDLWDTIFDDGAARPEPFAVLASADEWKTSADAVAPGHPLRFARRRRSSTGGNQNVGVHRAGDILI